MALVLAPFGAFAINLATITAAIGRSPEAHADPAKRYTAPVVAGIFYTLLGLAGGAVVALLAAFLSRNCGFATFLESPRGAAGCGRPWDAHELVATVAGLALLGSIAGGFSQALAIAAPPRRRGDDLPGHAVGHQRGRHRRGLLGRGRRQRHAGCAKLQGLTPRSAFGAPPDPQGAFQSRGAASGPAKPVPRRPLGSGSRAADELEKP